MILGTLLVLAFFAPAGKQAARGETLRWGLLAIGAAAYVDTALTWWGARDHERIPFGEIEGVGLSDPSKLSEVGWSPTQIVDRYLLLAGVCLAVIAGVWAWQTWSMRRRA